MHGREDAQIGPRSNSWSTNRAEVTGVCRKHGGRGDMRTRGVLGGGIVVGLVVFLVSSLQVKAEAVRIDSDDIGGVVTGANGRLGDCGNHRAAYKVRQEQGGSPAFEPGLLQGTLGSSVGEVVCHCQWASFWLK